MATLRLSSRAVIHLERIFEFIAERDPPRALQTIQRIREAVMVLEDHPLIGRPGQGRIARIGHVPRPQRLSRSLSVGPSERESHGTRNSGCSRGGLQ
ncbi:MAG: type II toxin-antitoxin system RelE/ParE family toxin [Gammaproteobacteria bacterium]|nr:type II toxin-antitoxin system RelE/ParE family toxin [Gammaproteobacteria bacterium]